MEKTVVIGSKKASVADLLIDDEYVSDRHAVVMHDGIDFYIEDLGSTNGTFLNGVKVYGRRILLKGDTIKVGRTEFIW